MLRDAMVKFRALRVRQSQRVGLQAFPDRVQQFCFLCRGEAIDLTSQVTHTSKP